MPPAPQRWKGQCENGTAFSPSNCNWKLIGARSFSKGLIAAGRNISTEIDYDSPRDFFGHGTHTSSTAAGNHVPGVSHFGYARGTASGVAPRAHIAMYKVLFTTDTLQSAASDVLAGMDQAIADGVDIMSLSLGFQQTPYFNDVIAIASLSAMEKGIVVVCATGNDGDFNATHNGALDHNNNDSKAYCHYDALVPGEVHGKVVLCDTNKETNVSKQKDELERVGAYAGILITDTSLLHSRDYTIPCLAIPTASGALVRDYVTGVTTPKVRSMEFITTKLGTTTAPQVAYFSSRGPDPISPNVLKPDILAPGVDVLAAIASNKPYMKMDGYDVVTDYALFSGTSMAAPHVAGVAALLKSVHPEWSPAAIRSAIMTTAYVTDQSGTILKDQQTGLPATPLDFGAGHLNPNKAMDPGLIYDLCFQDYIDFLCRLGYTEKQLSAIIRQSQWNCSQEQSDLNYPSFINIFNKESSPMMKKFSRVVTNVGNDRAVYNATLVIPPGMRVTVEPSSLSFTQKYQNQGYSVNLEIDTDAPTVVYGYLKWSDQHNHVVSSPLVAVKL
ncbi:hypothetical protein GH714_012781 [Hevea brasiliensis]|uniref:Subtilisin-like protease fibronectin type-III domain-containing protein n=1 Tax=Hevea brasiliensis TaxID=3981 RepID=A0A6A6NGT8_HEVBR|nr:hypothetical protein GH714_012781 [Hevea brasiliensis]